MIERKKGVIITMETVKCVKCGKICKPDCIVAGYAVDNEGNKYCYKCAAKKSAQTLRDLPIGGKTYLYLVARNNSWSVQDFMGLLSIPVYHVKLGRHKGGSCKSSGSLNTATGAMQLLTWH